jgi:hypothetical protein
VRILAVIGATSVASASLAACGSDSPTTSGGQPDAADERAADANAASDSSDSSAGDTSQPDTSVADSAGDERQPTIRRPFLVGSSMRSARGEARDDWAGSHFAPLPPLGLDDATRRELAKAWLADALEEHASIAAFARFTMLMLSVGAPPELVVAAQRASIDEVAHARDCFALARRYGATAAGPGALDVHDAMPPMSLADLAALTAEEGCVGETLGAALAAEQLAGAVDPDVKRVLGRLVRDEARHAELAWRFVAWAIGEEQRGRLGAAGVTSAVTSAIEHAVAATRAMTIRPCLADLDAWHAHGRLTCAEAREASERAIVDVVLPCLTRLGISGRGAPADAPIGLVLA